MYLYVKCILSINLNFIKKKYGNASQRYIHYKSYLNLSIYSNSIMLRVFCAIYVYFCNYRSWISQRHDKKIVYYPFTHIAEKNVTPY